MSFRTRIFVTTLGLALAVIAAVWFFSARQISTTVIESVVSHDADVAIQSRRAGVTSAIARAYAAGDRRRVDALVADPANRGLVVAVAEHGRITTTNVGELRGASVDDSGNELVIRGSTGAAAQQHRMAIKASGATFQRVTSPAGDVAIVAVLPQNPARLQSLIHVSPELRSALEAANQSRSTGLGGATVRRLQRDFLVAGIVAVIGSLIAALALSASIANPVARLTAAASAIAGGAREVRVDVRGRDELARLGVAFNGMSAALARMEQQRRELVADVAHELRTPLNNLHVELEAIRDGLAQATPARIDSLYQECDRLAALVEDLQELSLADAGALTIDRQPIAVDDLVRSAVTASRVAVAQHDATVSSAIAGDLPLVSADGEKLRRVLVNLIRNAAGHGRDGGTIGVSASANGTSVVFAVADDGPGIPAADVERIFERFYRVDKSRNRATGGSGLGLAIARRLVEAHGGTIAARNNPGGGATFTFTVPIAPGAAQPGRTPIP